MNALTRNGMGAGGGPDDNAAQAGHVVAHALTCAGHDASEDGTGRGTPLVVAPPVLGKQSPGFPNSADYAVLAPALTASWANNGGTGGHDGRDEAVLALTAATWDSISSTEVDVAPTIDSRAKEGPRRNQAAAIVRDVGQVVRRLTPTECERLQALPDGWTAITWRGRPAADSLRYAALGDAVTASVGAWIGARLAAELAS